MKIQRFTKQQYFPHEVAIAVYYTTNYAYKFKPGSENRYLRDFWKITYIEKGSGIHLFNEVRHPFEEGSILLSRPNDLTTAELESDIRLYNILFFKESLGSWLKEAGGNRGFFAVFQNDKQQNSIHDPVCQLKGNRKIKMLVKEMRREFLRGDFNSPMLLKLYLMELLMQMSRLCDRQFSRNRRSCLASCVLSRLEQDYSEEFDYRKAAADLGITHIHLCSAYRKETGETIGQSLLRIRLKNAKRLLTESRKSIIEISTLCGFNDLSYFYRAFKKETGMAPGDFRKHSALF